MFLRVLLLLSAVVVLSPASAIAQSLDRQAQQDVVAHLELVLRESYVFPDRIPALSAELDGRVQSDPIEAEPFAFSLAQGLVKASGRQLRVGEALEGSSAGLGRDPRVGGGVSVSQRYLCRAPGKVV